MKKLVEVEILGQRFLIKTEDEEDYVRKVVDYVNGKIEEVKTGTRVVSTLDLALLVAMNIADDYFKSRDRLARLELRSVELVRLIDSKI